MEDWERKQDHENEVRAALKDLGCLDEEGRLRTWHGPAVYAALAECGHSDLEYVHCECGRHLAFIGFNKLMNKFVNKG